MKTAFEAFKADVEANYVKKTEATSTYLTKNDFQTQIDEAYASLESALGEETGTETETEAGS